MTSAMVVVNECKRIICETMSFKHETARDLEGAWFQKQNCKKVVMSSDFPRPWKKTFLVQSFRSSQSCSLRVGTGFLFSSHGLFFEITSFVRRFELRLSFVRRSNLHFRLWDDSSSLAFVRRLTHRLTCVCETIVRHVRLWDDYFPTVFVWEIIFRILEYDGVLSIIFVLFLCLRVDDVRL